MFKKGRGWGGGGVDDIVELVDQTSLHSQLGFLSYAV